MIFEQIGKFGVVDQDAREEGHLVRHFLQVGDRFEQFTNLYGCYIRTERL